MTKSSLTFGRRTLLRTSTGIVASVALPGSKPVTLPNGEKRGFLLDGDEIIFKGRCSREGYTSIGFGSCVGRIEPAELAAAGKAAA
jgi:hypothetical protein